MFAQVKDGKLVRLTSTVEDGVELMEKGVIDGLHKVSSLDDIARVLKESAPTKDEIFASIERYMDRISNSINKAADAMEEEFSKTGGLKENIEAWGLQAKNAGEAALKGLRRTVEDIKKSGKVNNEQTGN